MRDIYHCGRMMRTTPPSQTATRDNFRMVCDECGKTMWVFEATNATENSLHYIVLQTEGIKDDATGRYI